MQSVENQFYSIIWSNQWLIEFVISSLKYRNTFPKNLDLDGILCVMFSLCLLSLGAIGFVKTYCVLHGTFLEAPCEAEYITNERDRVWRQNTLLTGRTGYGSKTYYLSHEMFREAPCGGRCIRRIAQNHSCMNRTQLQPNTRTENILV